MSYSGHYLASAFETLFGFEALRFSDWHKLRFSLDYASFWWAIPLMIALALMGYWSYRKQSASPRKRLLMGLLRAGVLVILLGLFLRPTLVLDQESKVPSIVAVWLDDSKSMDIADPYSTKTDTDLRKLVQQISTQTPTILQPGQVRANRFQLAIDSLTGPHGQWLRQLAEKQHIALYTGGAHAQLLGLAKNPAELDAALATLKQNHPSSEATDVPTVVQDILRNLQGQPVSALILLTDGRTTEGTLGNVGTAAAQQFHTPIFTVPLGQAEEPLNVRIAEMTVPESTFVRDPVAVKLKLHISGLTQTTPLSIHLLRKLPAGGGGGQVELTKRVVNAEPNQPDLNTELIFRPEKPGAEKTERFDLEVRIDPIGDELTQTDNTMARSTTVMDAKIAALYVEGYPRWEYRYLKNELIREKTVDVSTFLVSADDGFAQEGDVPITRFPETAGELAKYDVLLIGDVDPQFFSPNQMKIIVEWVRKGGGIGFISGWQFNPDSYRNTILEPLLPIIPDDPNQHSTALGDTGPFNLILTAAGKESNLFRFFDDPDLNQKQITENPPLFWYKPVLGLKGNAEVLARHPTRTLGGEPAPLIVTGPYDGGQTFFSALADTWRWRRYKGEPIYQSYWLQVCRLLYREKALGQSRRIQLLADTSSVEVGSPVHLTAHVRDATLLSALPQEIILSVTDDAGHPLEPITLRRGTGTQEMYEGLLTPTSVGTLSLQLPTSLPVDTTPLKITVDPPRREFANITADIPALTQLAQRTEGQLITPNNVTELATLIADRSQITITSLSEELWNKWPALALVVVLLTIEWLIRKSSGLI